MAEPPKPSGMRLFGLFGLLIVCFVAGSLLVPNGDDTPARRTGPDGETTFVDFYNHPVGFRMLVPLARSTRTGHGSWFETTISFGYSVAREDTDTARAQIREHFNAAGDRIKKMLSQHERMDYVNDIDSITSDIKETLNDELFPDGIAKVETVSWDRFEFRSSP
ncbi:MAG: hypothetical protein KDB80_10745, partial [Planctomycetes bacterium]|nr:hypothetical protein [Planctomycetota bacterium]